jgi:hypothetical protein
MVSHFSRITIFTRFFGSALPICLMIIHTPIPIVFFPSLPTWGSHSHFVEIKYMTRGPIGRSVVCSSSPLHFSPYNSSTPYLCFPFLDRWYTYNMSHIICGFYVFTIARGVINIKSFNAVSEVCSLVSSRVGPFYITSSLFFYSWFGFSYFGCSDGIHIICWIIYSWGSLWEFWYNI